jgi:hypothetical protein
MYNTDYVLYLHYSGDKYVVVTEDVTELKRDFLARGECTSRM